MIVLAGLGIEPGPLFVQEEGTDLPLLDETVQVAINGGQTDPRQLSVNPSVDLMGEWVRVIALESGEHLLQLTCCTFSGPSPHCLPSSPGVSDGANVDGCGLPNGGSAVKRFSVTASDKRQGGPPDHLALSRTSSYGAENE